MCEFVIVAENNEEYPNWVVQKQILVNGNWVVKLMWWNGDTCRVGSPTNLYETDVSPSSPLLVSNCKITML